MSDELVPIENSDIQIARAPEIVLAEAKSAAKALGDVLNNKKKPVIINGEQYLEFEDWQTVGRFYGVTAKVVSTEQVDFGAAQGFLARAVAMRSDGMEISAAEAMCLNDEARWGDKPLFQLRSMAQTRACAKALRNILAWVVVLAGYKATPAEEMTEQRPPIRQPEATEQTAGATTAPTGTKISEGQRKRFWAIAKGTGAADDTIKNWLVKEFGFTHTADITRDVYDDVCDRARAELR